MYAWCEMQQAPVGMAWGDDLSISMRNVCVKRERSVERQWKIEGQKERERGE